MTAALPRDAHEAPAAYQLDVGRRARRLVEAWERTPRDVLHGDRWAANPARIPASHNVAEAIRLAAAAHGIRPSDVGPCARCRTYHRRYGHSGGPLCAGCRAPLPADVTHLETP